VPDTTQRVAAFRAERDALLALCRELTTGEWQAPSQASGWRVQDVIAHIAGESHMLFQPLAIRAMRSRDIERFNDECVAARHDRAPADVLAEYEKWTRRLASAMTVLGRPPLGAIPLRIGELGWYPGRMLMSAYTFDVHTHLRYDIAPALGRSVPDADGASVAVINEWLLALLAKTGPGRRAEFDRPIGLTLTGAGGGSWLLQRGRRGRVEIVARAADAGTPQVTSPARDLPAWSTTRTSWRDHDLTLAGDADYLERFLDAVNLV